MTKLLDVRNLVTKFHTEDGIVHAVNGISRMLRPGESIGIVGESGSGKSVGVMSIMGLIPAPPGRVEGVKSHTMGVTSSKFPMKNCARYAGVKSQ